MESLFSYTDYRLYLKDYIASKKAENGSFSLKKVADRAGFKARDFILRIMKGERNLSQSGSYKMSDALRLSEKETDYFINLVAFNQAEAPKEKEFFYQKMAQVCRHVKQQKLRQDQFNYFSEWYYAALRSILPVIDFKDDFRAIGRFLSPPLSASQVEKAITFLLELGLLEKDPEGKYHVTTPQLTAGEAVKSVAMMRFHKQSLDLARRALESCSPEQRDITGVTMSLSRKGFGKIREEIAAFRKKVMCIAEEDSNEEGAFQLNMQLFPLSKRRTNGTA
ncbi:MAG: TIGR02147 family protein [Chitinispirillaceae bacterium]|nr:TIGR02147 family protein [Chitinispirillaceae bacterium]